MNQDVADNECLRGDEGTSRGEGLKGVVTTRSDEIVAEPGPGDAFHRCNAPGCAQLPKWSVKRRRLLRNLAGTLHTSAVSIPGQSGHAWHPPETPFSANQ